MNLDEELKIEEENTITGTDEELGNYFEEILNHKGYYNSSGKYVPFGRTDEDF